MEASGISKIQALNPVRYSSDWRRKTLPESDYSGSSGLCVFFAPKGPKQISPGQSATAKPCSVALGNQYRSRSALKGRNTDNPLRVSPLQG